ncbi:GNAT family N-acetyltransferase [Nocardioides sp.]|uniref:GNAT family N-acetyltransferase n=1 Tax=Nocardioides sp. TaxID=35761 RepID=UPI002B7FE1E1|nr:GNAT family N-acetyltransferase [Nocardioides sp.]HXH78273.1 GNAT family N-acetyltransferase [Nocardioides sp.]
MRFSTALLADLPECIPAVADLRWREWGHPPEPVERSFWLDVTTREAGRSALPVTFVCLDDSGEVVGAVGLDVHDLEERRETSPWVIGTIVSPDRRGSGAGRLLMRHLEHWATEHGFGELWVGTSGAAGFYRGCGWQPTEDFVTSTGQRMFVLSKQIGPAS